MLRPAAVALPLACMLAPACAADQSLAPPPAPRAGGPTIVSPDTREAEHGPNFVLIYADDLGYGDIGVNNLDSKIRTPHIDRLAAEGMRFTDAHSAHSVCSPSRYALLTGRYPFRGDLAHRVVMPWEGAALELERQTLPELLKQQGYRTVMVGKWHLGWRWGYDPAALTAQRGAQLDLTKPLRGGPLDHGFDVYFGEGVINMPPYAWIDGDRIVGAPLPIADQGPWGRPGRRCQPGPMAPGWSPAKVLPRDTKEAVAVVQAAPTDAPFFLYFALPSPHLPHVPSPPFRGQSGLGDYADYVQQTDDAVGQVLTALRARPDWKRTVVLFTSDNGSFMFELQAHGHATNGPFRGGKWTYWEGGHRVPFIIRWPSVADAGSVNSQLVSQLDVMATVADSLGVDLGAGTAEDSRSLLPTLEDPTRSVRDELVHLDQNHRGKWCLRQAQWKYCEDGGNRWDPDADHGSALFNLSQDPAERDNVLHRHATVGRAHQARINELREAL